MSDDAKPMPSRAADRGPGTPAVPREDVERLRADPEVRRAMAELDADASAGQPDPLPPPPASEQREHVEVEGKPHPGAKPAPPQERDKVIVGDRDRLEAVAAETGIDPAEFRKLPQADRRAATMVDLRKAAELSRSITGTAKLATPPEVREAPVPPSTPRVDLKIDLDTHTLGGRTERTLPRPDLTPPPDEASIPLEPSPRRWLLAIAALLVIGGAIALFASGALDEPPSSAEPARSAEPRAPTASAIATAAEAADPAPAPASAAPPGSAVVPTASASSPPSAASARPSPSPRPAPKANPARGKDPFGEL